MGMPHGLPERKPMHAVVFFILLIACDRNLEGVNKVLKVILEGRPMHGQRQMQGSKGARRNSDYRSYCDATRG